jgi:hypothetical protein
MKNNTWLPFLIATILFIALGLARDFIFVNWNYQLDFVEHSRSFSYTHSFFDFLNNFDFQQLYWSKWLFTGFFTVCNYFVGYFLFKKLSIKTPILKTYLLVFSAAILLFGFAFVGYPKGYLLSRELMGFLQSPLPTIVLLLTQQIQKKNPNTEHTNNTSSS